MNAAVAQKHRVDHNLVEYSTKSKKLVVTQDAGSASSSDTKKSSDESSSLFQLECSLQCVSLSLLKEGKKFFETKAVGLSSTVDIKGDQSTSGIFFLARVH